MRLSSKLGLSPLGEYHARLYGKSLYFDNTHTQQTLKWKPVFGNIEMMVDSYNWYLKNKESLRHQKDISAHKSPLKKRSLALLPLLTKVLPEAK
jgi:hypothetical protein